ncbi:NAD-dependent epimerase/dehydratase family protein [Pelagibacteraceae bacterium]|nr:NAD-dependent epimerase/dehydratase family protein [Pelagibacteraceae bacterium]
MKNNTKDIGLIGFKGFVGSAIYENLSNNYEVIGIDRNNYSENKLKDFDIIINSAMPSKRFWAKFNPDKDYEETVLKTKNILKDFNFNKIIHISSISARCQLETTYGKNKKKSEQLVSKSKNYLIIRLGPMYGKNLDKGVLIDLINDRKVFCNSKSKYSFTNLDFITNWISDNLKSKGIVELGAQNYIEINKLKTLINSKSTFEGDIDNQIIISKNNYNQDSYDVISFCKFLK